MYSLSVPCPASDSSTLPSPGPHGDSIEPKLASSALATPEPPPSALWPAAAAPPATSGIDEPLAPQLTATSSSETIASSNVERAVRFDFDARLICPPRTNSADLRHRQCSSTERRARPTLSGHRSHRSRPVKSPSTPGDRRHDGTSPSPSGHPMGHRAGSSAVTVPESTRRQDFSISEERLMADLRFGGALIVDGTGDEPRTADVAVTDGRDPAPSVRSAVPVTARWTAPG